ncbi:MAG: PP2C family protein-serine/threonine phosphatase [Myxococcota bacterium]
MATRDEESAGAQVDLEHVLGLIRRAMTAEAEGNQNMAGKVWVEGVDDAGLTVVCVRDTDALYRIKVADLQALLALVGPPLRKMRPPDALQLPYTPRTVTQLEVSETTLAPGEAVSVSRLGSDAQSMERIEAVCGSTVEAAGYTCRGPTAEAQGLEYKPINEDGVVVRLRAANLATGVAEVAAIGAFDQAGGEGAVENQSGAASEAAGRAFEEAVRKIESGADPEEALRESVHAASEAVRALGVGAVSTFAGAVVVNHKAYVVTVGDSRVLLFDRLGTLKRRTELHNMGAKVAAGDMPDIPPGLALRFAGALSRGVGTEDDTPDIATWELTAGDRLVAETDGIGDARELEEMPGGVWHADKCAEDQGRILAHVEGAPAAVAALVGYALDQMAARYGKPDNIGGAVLVVLEPRALA